MSRRKRNKGLRYLSWICVLIAAMWVYETYTEGFQLHWQVAIPAVAAGVFFTLWRREANKSNKKIKPKSRIKRLV